MIYVREFEFYGSEGSIVAVPCDMEGGTFGQDLPDAVRAAADWLTETVNDCLMQGEDIEGGEFGHTAQHGGQVIAIAVDSDLSRIDAVTAADAARMLGVSTARVAQMCASRKLDSWKDGSRRMVTRASVQARLDERPKAGRPRKSIAAAL